MWYTIHIQNLVNFYRFIGRFYDNNLGGPVVTKQNTMPTFVALYQTVCTQLGLLVSCPLLIVVRRSLQTSIVPLAVC